MQIGLDCFRTDIWEDRIDDEGIKEPVLEHIDLEAALEIALFQVCELDGPTTSL